MNENIIKQVMSELGTRSAKAREKKLGKKGMSEQMRKIRAMAKDKKKIELSTG